jgi:4-amino-4-deoxychorismate lyase
VSGAGENVLILRAGQVQPALDPADRALAYGDGLFETMLVHAGEPVWWAQHWQRLQRGAAVLAMDLPDQSWLRAACETLLKKAPARCVLKIIVSRGSGGRGYRPPLLAQPVAILSWHPAPETVGPVRLRWCELHWAVQPRLAGIKHLNRLEQVLARAEWADPAIFDGLVLDTRGHVVSATSANVFALVDGRWCTPALHGSGIAGLLRAWVLETVEGAVEADLTVTDIESAEAVFLCNAVRGILPVRQLGDRVWPAHPAIAALSQALAAAQPAFELQET